MYIVHTLSSNSCESRNLIPLHEFTYVLFLTTSMLSSQESRGGAAIWKVGGGGAQAPGPSAPPCTPPLQTMPMIGKSLNLWQFSHSIVWIHVFFRHGIQFVHVISRTCFWRESSLRIVEIVQATCSGPCSILLVSWSSPWSCSGLCFWNPIFILIQIRGRRVLH